MHQMNEDRQTMANRLKEINDLVAAVREGQQKTWGAIETINKDLQGLIQKDAGTDGEDEADSASAATNWDIPESAPVGTSSISTPWSWLEGIPEEEESSVKDSVTSGLLLKQPNVGTEASGSGEPVMPSPKVNTHDGEDIVIEKKMAPAASKTEEKGELSMGPMVTSGWQSKDYSVPVEEFVLLVGKSMGMPGATSGGFVPRLLGLAK